MANWFWFALTVLSFNLGLKSKENTIVLPLVLFLYSLLFGQCRNLLMRKTSGIWPTLGSINKAEVIKLGILAIQALVFYVSRSVSFESGSPDGAYYMSLSPFIVLKSMGWYLAQIMFVGVLVPQDPASDIFASLFFILVFSVALAFAIKTRNSPFVFGWLVLWVGLIPTAVLSNHFDYQLYIYMPMIGFAIAVGSLVARDTIPRRGARVVTLAIAFFIASSILWTRVSGSAKYTIDVSNRDRRIMYSLSKALPVLTGSAQLVVLDLAELGPFTYGPGVAAMVWYQNVHLTVHFAESEDQVANLITEEKGKVYIVRWKDDHFVSVRWPPTGGEFE